MKLNAGALDRRLKILSPTITQDEQGGQVSAYAVTGCTYAQRLELRTQDAARAGQRDTFAVARFRIRYRDDLTPANRVEVDGQLFDVLAIDEPNGERRVSVVLTCEQVTA